jgi:hypothetical protein
MRRAIGLAAILFCTVSASPPRWIAWRDCVRGSYLQYGCLSYLEYGGLSSLEYGGRSRLQYGGLSSLQGGGLSSLAGGGQVEGRTRGFTPAQLRRMDVDMNYIPQ